MTGGEAIDLPRAQGAIESALAAIDEVCRRLAVEYWIDGGTLLGSVRHSGPIPWDDDADLCFMAADFDRFVAHAKPILGDSFSLQTRDDDPILGADAKVYINGTHAPSTFGLKHSLQPPVHDGLFVDIFVAEPAARFRSIRNIEDVMSWIIYTRPWARRMARSPGSLSRATRLRWTLVSRIPQRCVAVLEMVLRRNRLRRSHDLLVVGGSSYSRAVVRYVDVFPLARREFGRLSLSVPANWDRYLSLRYGPDYMTPLGEADRGGHSGEIRFDGDG